MSWRWASGGTRTSLRLQSICCSSASSLVYFSCSFSSSFLIIGLFSYLIFFLFGLFLRFLFKKFSNIFLLIFLLQISFFILLYFNAPPHSVFFFFFLIFFPFYLDFLKYKFVSSFPNFGHTFVFRSPPLWSPSSVSSSSVSRTTRNWMLRKCQNLSSRWHNPNIPSYTLFRI